MSALNVIPQTACAHCGKTNAPGSTSGFCCPGCQAVYSLLHQSGLGQFYELRDSGYCFKPAEPAAAPDSRDFAAWTAAEGARQLKIFVEGVHCTACLWILEKLPQLLPATVVRSRLDIQSSVLTVELAAGADPRAVGRQVLRLGYVPHLIRDEDEARALTAKNDRRTLIELAVAGALAGNVMLMSIPLYSGVSGRFETYFEWVSLFLATPSLFYCGRSFFKNVGYGIRSRRFPIDAPILLALLIAFFYSVYSLAIGTHALYFDSMTALVFLLLSSRYYLAKLRQSSNLNLGVLEFFQPRFDGKAGDVVEIAEGAVLPFDGVVTTGELWMDLARFSGETIPVLARPGDRVYAGTTVTQLVGEPRVRVTQVGTGTRLAGLLQRVKESRQQRSRTEIRSDRLSRGLLAVVTTIGLAALALFISRGQAAEGIHRVLALLIVTCPCALALATPLTFSMAMKSLLGRKVLVKDPEVLDSAGSIRRIYFDKTGTLTTGDLTVVDGLETMSADDRAILLGLCSHSTHPVSRAIYRALEGAGARAALLEDVREQPGLGVSARRGSETCSLRRASRALSDLGAVSFYRGEREIALIHVQDRLRADTAGVIAGLQADGFEPVILSGDHARAVSGIAFRLGGIEAHAGLTPEQKAEAARDGMMVGDGLNDTLSLVSSRIGVAVQGGMEAAIASSQVISLKPGVSAVVDLLGMSALVRRVIVQNFVLSTAYNCVGAYLSLTGRMNPLLAAVLMPMSAITVFSATLWRFRAKETRA